MRIMTDHKWKNFKQLHEVPKKLADDFDWLDEDSKFTNWIWYRKRLYHLSDFMDLSNRFYVTESPFPKPWHGYLSDSFFSGVLIEISDDGEQYRIGTYIG